MKRRSASKKPSERIDASLNYVRPTFNKMSTCNPFQTQVKCSTPKHGVRGTDQTPKYSLNNNDNFRPTNSLQKTQARSQNVSVPGYTLQQQQQQKPQKFIPGYNKIELLGKGGCASVWLCDSLKLNKHVAVKQIQQDCLQTAKKEMKSAYLLAELDHPGMKFICNMLDMVEYKGSVFLVYELAGSSLGKSLFDIKGEFYKGQRVYKIIYLPLYMDLINNIQLIKEIIKAIASSLVVLSQKNIIHGDLKPDNVLIKCKNQSIESIKLIDFGNSFVFGKSKNLSSATPEYLPPEALISINNGLSYTADSSWSLDI